MTTLILLISIGTLTDRSPVTCALYLLLLLAVALVARIPLTALIRGAAVVLPFALCFALTSALSGQPARAVMLIVRACLSALAAFLLIATTPMPNLIAGLEWLRAPRFLLQVMQFLYRYLTVLTEEADVMRMAALARAGSIRALQFRHASAAAGALFARSWARALAIHRAMLSRGFEGAIPTLRTPRFELRDAAFTAGAAILTLGLRFVPQ